MAFCSACGNDLIATAVVCPKCGSAVNGKAAATLNQGEAWPTGHMVGLCIGTVIIPLIGIIAGIYGLCKEPKRSQGGILLGLGVVATILWVAIN